MARTRRETSRRRVPFVVHCLVNQNAKVAGFARLSGVVSTKLLSEKEVNAVVVRLLSG